MGVKNIEQAEFSGLDELTLRQRCVTLWFPTCWQTMVIEIRTLEEALVFVEKEKGIGHGRLPSWGTSLN